MSFQIRYLNMKFAGLLVFVFLFPALLFSQELPDSLQAGMTSSGDSLVQALPDSNVTSVPDSLSKVKKEKKKREKKVKESKPPRVPIPPDTLPRPTLGVNIGLLSYNGDIKSNENVRLPFSGGLAVGFSLSQELSSSFAASLDMMIGNLSANERSLDRNLNFRSTLFTAGGHITYNFNHFLNEKRSFKPYVTFGLEAIQFSSKSDLLDKYGNKYHYWSDGTIRNISETSPYADQSVLLQRDYVYETDIRSKDYDGRGNYSENALGIPIGVGADIRLTSKIDFGFNYTYHFTMTDDIDGVNKNSTGERLGNRPPNSRNDAFWFLSAGIKYNFTRSITGDMEIMDQWTSQDLVAFGTDDYDGDGIYDFMDECPQTEFGVEVNERGCPLNPKLPPVLTDSQIYARYLSYIDSTGLYTKIEKRAFSSTDKQRLKFKRGKKSFKIKLGEFVGGVPQEVSNALLGLPDVETHISGDTTIFTVGDYDNLPEAIQRKIKVAIEGFEDAEIVMQNERGKIVALGDEGGNIDVTGANYDPNYLTPFVFRVQLGAFKKKKPDEAFRKVQNLVVVENEQGFTKYMSGAFDTYVEASKHKIEMIAEGWGGAFVVAYKRGQGRRITMQEAGVTEETVKEAKAVIAGDKTLEEVTHKTEVATEPEKPKEPEFDKSRVKFKIQIGIYKNQVPPDVLSEYMKLNNLAEIEVDNSSAAKRYTSGEFSDYESAVEYRNKLIQKGFETAFIIALKDGELVSIDEARKLIGDVD